MALVRARALWEVFWGGLERVGFVGFWGIVGGWRERLGWGGSFTLVGGVPRVFRRDCEVLIGTVGAMDSLYLYIEAGRCECGGESIIEEKAEMESKDFFEGFFRGLLVRSSVPCGWYLKPPPSNWAISSL